MKKLFNSYLNLLSKAVSAICLFSVSMATGTISHFGIYEPEMPAVLRPKDDDAGV